MKNCFLKITDDKVFDELKKLIGDNEQVLRNYINESYQDDSLSDNFIEWYQTYNDVNNVNKLKPKDLAKLLVKHYQHRHPDTNDTVNTNLKSDISSRFGYGSLADREEGKRHVGTILIDMYRSVQQAHYQIKGNILDYYKNALKKRINNKLFERIANIDNLTIEEVKARYEDAQDKTSYLENALGGEDISIQNKNLLAIYKELNSSKSTADNYLFEVFCDKDLQEIRSDLKDDLDSIETNNQGDENAELNGVNTSEENKEEEYVPDGTMAQYGSHMGAYSNFMKHIGPRIRTYFRTLSVITSTEKFENPTTKEKEYPIDTNNRFGLPNTMDANRCCAILYSEIVWTNVPDAIKQIRLLSQRRGFESFAKFADDLAADPDFATEVFTTFAKTVIEKMQLVVSEGVANYRTTNQRANKQSAFLYNLMNDLRVSAIDRDMAFMSTQINGINESIESLKGLIDSRNNPNQDEDIKEELTEQITKERNNIVSALIKSIKSYFPSVEEKAIIAYIELNDNPSGDITAELQNINRLLRNINNICKTSEDTRKVWISRQAQIDKVIQHNNNVKKDAELGHWHDSSDYLDLDSLYDTDFLSEKQSVYYRELASMLVEYSIVEVELNSPNVHGNNSSNVINNSHLTNLIKILNESYEEPVYNAKGEFVKTIVRNKALEAWGKEKLRSKQYKYSSILVEQYDAQGKPINDAIFKVNENGDIIGLTDNAPYLLKLGLFDGSSDLDSGTDATYPEMLKGSFLPTAFMSYFTVNGEPRLKQAFGNYILRTPSDAPKTFTLRGPKYDISELRVSTNQNALETKVNEIIDNLPILESINPNYVTNTVLELTAKRLKEAITSEKPLWIEDQNALKKLDDEGNFVVMCRGRGDMDRLYFFTGKLENRGGAKIMIEPKYLGMASKKVNDLGNIDTNLPSSVENALRNYLTHNLNGKNLTFLGQEYEGIPRRINRKHKVYQILKNQFKQEMLDAAIAVDHYFETDDDGWVKDKGTSKSTSKVIKLKKGKNNKKGYKFYHLDNNGEVLGTVTENGTTHYTLGGKVFHSDKFTLSIVDKDGNIVKKNYLDEVISEDRDKGRKADPEKGIKESNTDGKIHILYGGADTDSFLHVIKQDGKVIDVYFTDEQDASIEEALDNFISDYIDQAIDNVEPFKNFIKGVTVNEETITDFAVNSLVMFMGYDDLFEGSPKFYANSQTVLKRAKEYQGSGVPYGIADYSVMSTPSAPTDIKEGSFLNTGLFKEERKDKDRKVIQPAVTVQERFAGTILEGTTQRNAFVGVTVKNTKMTNDKVLGELKVQLVNQLVDSLVADGMTKKAAKTYAEKHVMDMLYGPEVNVKKKDGSVVKERRGGFTETKVNDAQSYITFNEWVRRVAARGQLKRYLPLIDRILDESKPLRSEDIQEFIQVQKNFYYDMHYDTRYGIEVPRQIKNAEFVLVPRLIKGTQLETVYNLMHDAGIDQLNTVETSKAANEDIITLWDDNGDLTGADTFVTECENRKQVYDYNHLYTQQETPQHLNASNKAGIQIMKKIIDNIPKNSPLYHKKEEYFKLFVQNIQESYNDLLDNLEVPRDENGNILFDEDGNIEGLNNEVFYNKLRDEMMRLGLDSNMIDYVTLDETGQPIMKAFMSNVLSKFESVAQSLFNNTITRQRLPGFHAAQVTNIGWRALGEQVTGRRYSEDLEYHPMQYINKDNSDDIISNRDYKKLTKEQQKQYKQYKNAGYIEIMLPLSNFGIDRNSEHYKNMTDDQILEELKEKGLDIIMGYRIPTEGKQSVCNMRVVGFTDDAYGSTIVVPNDWVSQTGSDFDIDSVYGIQFETYQTSDGEIHKIEYVTEPDIYDWFGYLKRFGDKTLDTAVKGKIKEQVKGMNNFFEETFDTLIYEEQKAYRGTEANNYKDGLPEAIKAKLKKVDARINREYEHADKKEKYIARLEARLEKLNDFYKKNKAQKDSPAVKKIKNYIDLTNSILNFVKNPAEAFRNEKNDRIKGILDDRLSRAHAVAEKHGLLSFEDYKKAVAENPEQMNSRKARNNQILSIMKDILADDTSLEENLSRSNFDDIIYWRDEIMNVNDKAERNNRSTYNVFDQISYQEDAMSGATLKGMSVALDTFCSVCNTVQPRLTSPITVVYDAKDFDNVQGALNRFGENKKYKGEDSFVIRHDTYGWSGDNRNVTGKILTAYSSQTTAHILDAIKEGAIPNVNSYTFATYKTLVNVGSDYKTAISFIMQPGVSRIVDNYNKTNSVFSDMEENPIHQAIKDIAENELGLTIEFRTPVNAILNSINANKTYKKIFNDFFKIDESDEDIEITFNDNELERIPLIVSKMVDRIQNKGVFENATYVEKAIFDLGVVLAFHKIHKTAGQVGNIARCCNPDKFGAKQTVFATNKVFEDIHEAIFNYNQTLDEEKPPILVKTNEKTGEDEHILVSIYPGIENGSKEEPAKGIIEANNVSESSYPTLYAFLKFASSTSTVIAKELFDTQHPSFVNAVKGITKVFSGNRELTEEEYDDIQKYLLSSVYNEVLSIKHPIVYVKDTENGDRIEINLNGDSIQERTRIFGFNQAPGLKFLEYETENILDSDGNVSGTRQVARFTPFEVSDINNPSKKEIEQFSRFSPAQKVQWIKTNFRNAGLFNMFQVSLYNDKRRGYRTGTQTIEFTEQNLNPNVIYHEFNKLFYNDNPLVKLAAFDCVKYAIIVEGLRMTNRGITKCIPNDVLLDDFGLNGTGFVKMVDDRLSTLGKNESDFSDDGFLNKIYERYLRSHPKMKGIRTIRLNKTNMQKFGISFSGQGLIYLPVDKSQKNISQEKAKKQWEERMKKAGIMSLNPVNNKYTPNSYVRFGSNKGSFLYRIEPIKDQFDNILSLVLYPLNPLETNETSDLSARQMNNSYYPQPEVYKALINKHIQELKDNNDAAMTAAWVGSTLISMRKDGTYVRFFPQKMFNEEAIALDFSIEELAEEGKGGMIEVLSKIRTHFNNVTAKPLYLTNLELTNYIFVADPRYGSIQSVKMPNNKRRNFIINKVDMSYYNKRYLSKRNGAYLMSDETFAYNIEREQNEDIKQAIKNAREARLTAVNNLFIVTPEIEEESKLTMAPAVSFTEDEDFDGMEDVTIEDNMSNTVVNAIEYMIVDSKHGNDLANKAIGKLNVRARDNKVDYVTANTQKAVREVANYAIHKAAQLKNRFERFIEDPTVPNTFISILDPRIQTMLEGNEALINKYLELINDLKAFIDNFAPFVSLDVTSEDMELKTYLNDVKRTVEELSKLPLEKAMHNFAEGYATRITTNPLVKTQLIKVMDGYYKTYGAMWRFHDIMENGNPLLQTILTDVMGDLDAKRIAKTDMLRKHHKEIARIQKEAAAHGMRVDLNKIIDENGRFREDYASSFVDKLRDLYKAKSEAAKIYGLGSIQHLRAKLDYDEFKAKHVNQEVVQSYYIAKCQNERTMIEEHPVIYEAYMKAYFKKLDLLNYISETGLNEDLQEQLRNVEIELQNLTHSTMYRSSDGTYQERSEDDLLTGKKEVRILNNYLWATSQLNKKYFKFDAVYGFEDHLKMCLNIVKGFEQPDRYGVPTVPQDILENNSEYTEAKNWIRKNARFVLKPTQEASANPNSIANKLQQALHRLSLAGNSKSFEFNTFISNVGTRLAAERRAQNPNYTGATVSVYDETGVIDGSLFTPEEIAHIKQIQARNYNVANCPPNTDRILISSAPKREIQYSAEFYAKFKTDGFFNPDYLAVVTELNKELEPYYDQVDGIVHIERIPDTEEGIATLNKIANLYLELKQIQSRQGGNSALNEAAAEFRHEHCEYDVNKTAWTAQAESALDKSPEYQEAFKAVTLERSEDGSYIYDSENGVWLLNRKLYGTIKPKGEPGTPEHDMWIDEQRTEDIKLVNTYYAKVPTKYYFQAQQRALARAEEDPDFDYNEWYEANHIYNPFTRKYELLPIWTTNELRHELFDENEFEGTWMPTYTQRERKVNDGKSTVVDPITNEEIEIYNQNEDFVNHNYDKNKTLAGNYIKGSEDGQYDTNISLNEYEIEMRDYLKRILMDTTANNAKAKRYFELGYLPVRADYKSPLGKRVLKEAGKLFGLALDKRKDELEWHENISYDKDEIPTMPMTELLRSKELGSEIFDEPEPEAKDFINAENPAEAYKEAHDVWEEKKKVIDDKNREIHNKLLDKDWLGVIDDYLSRAADYNAVQDNKQKLYYLLNMLQKQQVYMREHGMSGKLKKDKRRGSKDNPVYEQTIDRDLIEQYTTFIRRILFDQWKENEGKAVSFANRLQNFTSANYMMLNVRGGIANVTLGETGILAEAAAREYISMKDWGFGTLEWNKGLIGFMHGMYKETAINKQDAITKYFKVVDYDEITGVSREVSMEEYSNRVRDAMFSPQTIGEHYMQNSVLFAMLNSHKIIALDDDARGIGYIYMNEEEYVRYRQAQELKNILTDEQKRAFKKFKQEVKDDKDELAEYAWWRRDILTDFIYLHCDKEQQEQFLKDRKEQDKKFRKEFSEETSIYDQLKLDEDGYMGFKDGSKLAELKEQLIQDGKLDKTQWLMGRFAERVRKVNNKIHGVYNRKGQAWIERKWYGSLIMQYHKHLPIGLLKRYRARGFYSESRGTREKGMLQSITDFLSLNVRKIQADNGWTSDNVTALESLQFWVKHSLDYLGQLRHTMRFLPEHEKANMRRNLGDLVGVTAALCTTVALLAAGDDDEDGLAYNMMLYEADRLGSEAFLYNPIGMWTETKKLMSTPIAAQSIVGDVFSAIGNICGYILGGEDYDMTYQSGRFAGRNKVSVYLERRIPIWNGIRGVLETPDNNHYYKLGDTAMTLVPTKDIANWITK